MELKYKNLHNKLKKLGNITHSNSVIHEQHSYAPNTQPRVINLTNKQLTGKQLHILSKGPQYAIETAPKKNIDNIIAETECAIKHVESKWQNTYRFLAAKQIKKIKEKQTQNPFFEGNHPVVCYI